MTPPVDYPPHGEPGEARLRALRILIGGILGMMVAMGIGRFVYTPILPLMQRDLGMTNSVAGWLASLNFLGYLVGAILCSLFPGFLRNGLVNGTALAASLGTTLLMGLASTPSWWGGLRFGSGVASAVLFVVIAVEVTEALVACACVRWVGAIYGGVGLGIAFSGLMIPVFDRIGGWQAAWIGSGGVACVLAAVGVLLGGKRHASLSAQLVANDAEGDIRAIRPLVLAYFFEGLGYVISATFIVAMIARTPGLEAFAPFSWVMVGVAAAPSTVLWPLLARRLGARAALVLAYLVQASGIIVSIGATGWLSAGFAAISFGGTFLGIVAIVMAEGSRRAGREGRRAAAILTAAFGFGQVLGPPLAGILADRYGSFTLPLIMAAAAVVFGGFIVAVDRGFPRKG